MSWTRWSWTDRRNVALRKARGLHRQLIADQVRAGAAGSGQSVRAEGVGSGGGASAGVVAVAGACPPGGAPPGTPGRAAARPASPALGDETEGQTLFGGAPQAGEGGGG